MCILRQSPADPERECSPCLLGLLEARYAETHLAIAQRPSQFGVVAMLDGGLDPAKWLEARHRVSLSRGHRYEKIDAHSASFWAATNRGGDGVSLGLLERQRVKNWLHRAYDEIARLDP